MSPQKKILVRYTLFMVGIAILGLVVGILRVLVPEETLIRFVTSFIGESDVPMAFFSFVQFILVALMIGIFWQFTVLARTKNYIRWPLIIITPFNFGFPITIVYMIWKTITFKQVEHTSVTE